MKFHVLWPFAFGLAMMLTVNSCTKTVVGPTVVDSTVIRDTLRDTMRDTLGKGQAWIRFVSMFPDSITTTILVSKIENGVTSTFAFAANSVTGSYLPLRADTSYSLQLSSPNIPGWISSLSIPVLGNTMNTFALFLIQDQTVPTRSIDSEYLTPSPPGYCYLRFINGIGDGTAQYYLDLDTVYNDLFSQTQPVENSQITRYILIKTDKPHTLFLRTPGSSDTPLQTLGNFVDGSYYTVCASGSLTDNNAKLTIDQE